MTKRLSAPHISTRRWPRAIAVVTLSLSAVLAGCGGGNSGTTGSATHAGGAASVTTSAAASTGETKANGVSVSARKAAATSLSGRWSGQYDGTFQGTFTLTWRQTGNTLKGTIKLSPPPQTVPLTGTLDGSKITFGTVGSLAITYTGAVSGHSMSGTYKVAGGHGSGHWSATKSG